MADSTAPPTEIPEKKAPTGEEAPVETGGAGVKVKSEKELEKERKKAEKAKKFAEKQAKANKDAGKAEKKEKKVKETKVEEVLPPYVEETPVGEKKILKSLDDAYHKAYSPRVVESAWYSWWEKEGFFKPEFTADGKTKPEGSFVIPIPPPNVTGALHVGHALANVLQDALIRWNRMKGKTTLFLPGCDHAGISTQSVVEKMLWKLEKKTRYDLGREEFVRRAWEWKDDYHERITRALKRMGGSYDWSREAFTLDENLSEAVAHTFVTLHEEGIIYRANRLINWCVQLNTAISNLEVDNKEIEGRTLLDVPGYSKKVEFGVITHFKYPIEGSDETIEVATTRPETMLGDTGIAVHPDDKRYQHLVGKFAVHPIVDRRIPIVADTYVEMDFGTGAVKITPAHDHNDFALGKRHNLEFINIMNDDGTFNANAGPYSGQKRFDVRYSLVDELTKKGLFVKKEDNKMVIPICNKSKDVIEPIMKPQWWMSMKDMAEEAIRVVRDGTVKIRPETAERSYFKWLEGIQDWCLSRQLWWGHRCPVYFVKFEEGAGQSDDNNLWVSGKTEAEAREKAEKKFPGKTFTLEQDPDVLDTWFSSGLWPFSTLGWPKQTKDLENLYPTSLLETGWDILFFWVARMIMLGIKMTGKVPFTEVYCHQLVRDSEGRKMSKSLGNVIDPLDVIEGISFEELNGKLLVGNLDPKELATATKFQKATFPDGIPECGTDALRFCLAQYNTGGGDIQFDVKVMHGHRKFCNKIYQATKYVLGKLGNDYVPPAKAGKTGKESLAERWILHKMNACAKDLDRALADREFSKATQIIYAYWYNNLCDVYIENSKSLISSGNAEEAKSAIDTLYTALEGALLMIHPFMPFLTEELWQRLPRRPEDKTPSICIARFPVYSTELDDAASEEAYELLLDITKGLRSLTAEYAIKGEGKAFVQAFDDSSFKTATVEAQSIQALAGKGIGSVEILDANAPTPDGCVVSSVSAKASVFLHVKGRVDVDAEIKKADSKLKKTQESIKKQEKLLKDKNFLGKATDELKEAEQKKLDDLEAVVRGVEETVKELQKLRI